MATLTGETISTTYEQLIKLDTETLSAAPSGKWLETGKAENLPISVSTTSVGIGSTTILAEGLFVTGTPAAPTLDLVVFEALGADTSVCLGLAIDKDANPGHALVIKKTDDGTWYGSGSSTIFGVSNLGNVGIGMTSILSKLTISGLPTSASGLETGNVWDNSGVLTIVQ